MCLNFSSWGNQASTVLHFPHQPQGSWCGNLWKWNTWSMCSTLAASSLCQRQGNHFKCNSHSLPQNSAGCLSSLHTTMPFPKKEHGTPRDKADYWSTAKGQVPVKNQSSKEHPLCPASSAAWQSLPYSQDNLINILPSAVQLVVLQETLRQEVLAHLAFDACPKQPAQHREELGRTFLWWRSCRRNHSSQSVLSQSLL